MEWVEVRGWHRRRMEKPQRNAGYMDIARGTKEVNMEGSRTTTYYFSKIPDNYGAKEMHGVFQKYGKIEEVVIPSKRDKRGRRFGFVRVAGVTDPHRFGVMLDNIIIGRKKIYVNLPRFHREKMNGVANKEGKSLDQQTRRHQKTNQTYTEERRNGEKWKISGQQGTRQNDDYQSYAQVVRDGKLKETRTWVDKRKRRNTEFAHLYYEVDNNVVQQLEKAYVGVVSKPGMTYNIQEEFHRRGYFSVKVTPMGSNLALLEGADEGEIPALINDAKEWIGTITPVQSSLMISNDTIFTISTHHLLEPVQSIIRWFKASEH